MKTSITFTFLFVFSISIAAQNPYVPNILPMRERAKVIDVWLEDRVQTVLPKIMRRSGVDMWIIISREYNEDPVLKTFLPSTWQNARRNTMLVIYDPGVGKKLETYAMARYAVGKMFIKAWDKEKSCMYDNEFVFTRTANGLTFEQTVGPAFVPGTYAGHIGVAGDQCHDDTVATKMFGVKTVSFGPSTSKAALEGTYGEDAQGQPKEYRKTTFEISDDGETLTFSQNETTTETNAATGLQANVTKISTSVWTRGVATNNCTLQTATDAAATAYNNDNTEDLCNAYKTALQNQIAECGDANGSLQAIIDDLGDCTIDNVSNGDLRVTTGTLVIDFTTQSIETDNGVITVNGTSSSGSYSIYFQVTEGETGTDVLQNFKLTLNETEYLPSTQGVEDFTSNTTVNSGNILQATFYGLVVNNDNGTLSLTQGVADLTY